MEDVIPPTPELALPLWEAGSLKNQFRVYGVGFEVSDLGLERCVSRPARLF